jgi:hypothetical protein
MNARRDFGGVSVNRDADHPEAKNLPYPGHRVVGVVSSEDAAWRAIDRLKSGGFAEEQMELFLGGAGQVCLHNYHARSGALGHLRQMAESLGSDQDQSREYEEAVKQGHVVVAVKAPQEDVVERIREALAQEGATSLRYYGLLAIHDLS